MNGQQSTSTEFIHYRTPPAPILRSSWSSSTSTPSITMKRHSYHQNGSRQSRSSSFVQDHDDIEQQDNDEDISLSRRHSTLQYKYSAPGNQRQPFYQQYNNLDYANGVLHQRQGQRLQQDSPRNTISTHRQRPSAENKKQQKIKHHEEIRVQRKPPPIITMDTNQKPNYMRKQRKQLQPESSHLGHHHIIAPVGWKVSGQYDHLVLRSPLSSTPPSLYDSSSSSTTLSSSSDTNQRNGSSLTTNGLIYHRRTRSGGGGGTKHVIDYQQRQSTTTSSISSVSYNSNRSGPSSVNSISTRSRHSYEDQSSDNQMKTGIERSRRYSQGDCSNRNIVPPHSPPKPLVSRRVSTPKLRRVCSAKPYVDHSHLDDDTNNNNNNNDDDVDNLVVDAASLAIAKSLAKEERFEQPTFWNPRSPKDVIPVKRTLSRRLRGLLLPQRNKLDVTVSKDHHLTADYQWSLNRPMTPLNDISFDNDTILEDQENGVMDNPFYMISQSWDIVDQVGLQFNEDDFTQMDIYATSVQQSGPTLTPQMLAQKFLVRPYRRDLYRLRIIYIWIIQNIAIIDQRTGLEYQGGEDKTTIHGNTQPQLASSSSSKISFRQRFTTRRNTTSFSSSNTTDQDDELEPPTLDVMHGDGLLPEGGNDVDSFDDWLYSESAQQVLLRRACSSSIGLANIFCEMATAAGFNDTRVVYGYLRAPKDSIESARMDFDQDNCTLIQNHAWCCVKVEGEYRFVDCWLASSFQPQNKSKMESHWFLTKPADMIYTHFPQESVDQCLEPTIPVSTFFALPYVWANFFSHHIKMIRYNPEAIHLVDDQICHLTFRVDKGIVCFAYIEVDNTPTTIRCLAQSRMIPDENGKSERIYKIKAVLPPGHEHGWLKIYAGPSSSIQSTSAALTAGSGPTRQENISNGTSLLISRHHLSHTTSSVSELPPLAMCFRLTAQHQQQQQQQQHQVDRNRPFEFVHLHPSRHEFYIREPQCYQLYPLQTYNFLIRGDDTHHKLAIKSPSGKLYKLMYYPQEHTYDGSVKISESGKWSLISLLHHSGGWYVVASWECRS